MLGFFLVIILFVIGFVLIGMGRKDFDGVKVNLRPWATIPFVLGFIVLFFICTVQVDGGKVGVKKVFGEYQSGTVGPGLHIIAPWESIQTLDTRTQAYTMSAKSNEGDQAGDDSVSVVAKDQVSLSIDATVQTVVDGRTANKLLQNVGTEYTDKIIRPYSREIIRDKATQYDGIDIVTKSREAFSNEVEEALRVKFAKYGITLQSVQIRDMYLPQELQAQITAKASEAQKADAKLSQLRQAEVDADIKRTEAKALADAQQIAACGGKPKTVLIDGKKRDIITPNYGTDCDQSQLTPEFLQSQYIQALKALVNAPNNSTLILPTDSKLTPLLNMPGK